MVDGCESFAIEADRMRREVLDGLSEPRKRLPGTYLWDARGSELFDRICESEDYYLTRAETALLATAAPEVAALTGPGATLVEYGSGASRKVRLILDALPGPATYFAIDVSATFLAEATGRIAADYPDLDVLPLAADYTRPIALPERPEGPVLGGMVRLLVHASQRNKARNDPVAVGDAGKQWRRSSGCSHSGAETECPRPFL